MKSKANFKVVISLLVFACIALSVMFLINVPYQGVANALEPEPTVSWNGNQITWTEVPGATEYYLEFYNILSGRLLKEDYVSDNTPFDYSAYLLPENQYFANVCALKDGEIWSDYGQSEIKTIEGTRQSMTAITISGNIVSWQTVPNANGYEVQLKKKLDEYNYKYINKFSVADGTSKDISASVRQNGAGIYKVECYAYKHFVGNMLTNWGDNSASLSVSLEFEDSNSLNIPESVVNKGIDSIDIGASGAVSGGFEPYEYSAKG
jgi:hypothetical protein